MKWFQLSTARDGNNQQVYVRNAAKRNVAEMCRIALWPEKSWLKINEQVELKLFKLIQLKLVS